MKEYGFVVYSGSEVFTFRNNFDFNEFILNNNDVKLLKGSLDEMIISYKLSGMEPDTVFNVFAYMMTKSYESYIASHSEYISFLEKQIASLDYSIIATNKINFKATISKSFVDIDDKPCLKINVEKEEPEMDGSNGDYYYNWVRTKDFSDTVFDKEIEISISNFIEKPLLRLLINGMGSVRLKNKNERATDVSFLLKKNGTILNSIKWNKVYIESNNSEIEHFDFNENKRCNFEELQDNNLLIGDLLPNQKYRCVAVTNEDNEIWISPIVNLKTELGPPEIISFEEIKRNYSSIIVKHEIDSFGEDLSYAKIVIDDFSDSVVVNSETSIIDDLIANQDYKITLKVGNKEGDIDSSIFTSTLDILPDISIHLADRNRNYIELNFHIDTLGEIKRNLKRADEDVFSLYCKSTNSKKIKSFELKFNINNKYTSKQMFSKKIYFKELKDIKKPFKFYALLVSGQDGKVKRDSTNFYD